MRLKKPKRGRPLVLVFALSALALFWVAAFLRHHRGEVSHGSKEAPRRAAAADAATGATGVAGHGAAAVREAAVDRNTLRPHSVAPPRAPADTPPSHADKPSSHAAVPGVPAAVPLSNAAPLAPAAVPLSSAAAPLLAAAAPLSSAAAPPTVPRIAYVVTVTSDGGHSPGRFVDGAAVLAHSIEVAHETSAFGRAALVAFVSPSVGAASRGALRFLGFRVLEKQLPINVSLIEGKTLHDLWSKDSTRGGCCGAWELLKLFSWTLTEYERVVHVDMDCILLQPIDELFALDKALVFTSDYNMMSQKQRLARVPAAVQGGFLVVKPSMQVFHDLSAVSQRGSWGGGGWEKSGVGYWWGGNTIQGLLPYFFSRPDSPKAREVDRCVYDNMVDSPVEDPLPYVGQSKCRLAPLDSVKFVHFTVCQKPWSCRPNRAVDDPNGLCVALHKKWFSLRSQLESKYGLDADAEPCRKGNYAPIAFGAQLTNS
ncbi:hypothetical protein M885DRAFT_533074 [Pelagophyceae sp. CCMP2097]|nr:hypothetical protein M885DRAFT_533074 [Pelagophyceae sp. CCMP2097]